MVALKEAAEEALPWRRTLIDGSPWPAYWQSPAFASNLFRAAAGTLSLKPRRVTTAVAAAAFTAKNFRPKEWGLGLQAAVSATISSKL